MNKIKRGFYKKGGGEIEAFGGLIGLGLIALFIAWIFGFNFGKTNEGIVNVKLDDCKQVVTLKDSDWQTYFGQYTCTYEKTKSGKIMDGACVRIENDGSLLSSSHTCATAYVYIKSQNDICNVAPNLYLGYDDMCFTTPQGGEAVIQPTVNTPPVTTTPTQQPSTVSDNNSQKSLPSPNEKCVTENGDLKICDLSYSDSYYSSDFRNIFVEGNAVACVNMQTGEVSQGDAGRLRATTAPAFCATDFGYVYIDPTLKVSKYYGTITREDYSKPYKINTTYDTCLWTYNDGSGNIPYLEVLSSVGPRTGYNEKAFCVNGNNQVDIYSYKQN